MKITGIQFISLGVLLAWASVGCSSGDGAAAVVCGDGLKEGAEVCDDSNTVDGDGCAADCLSNESCGNGTVDGAAGEACDDGNTVDGDGCAASCLSDESCGNGIIDGAVGETCDDRNTEDGDGCSALCMKEEEVCGPPLTVREDDSDGVQLPDLVLSEVHPGNYVELWNTTDTDIALSEAPHQLCSPFEYAALSDLAPEAVVPSKSYVTVPWPENFADTADGGEVILYSSTEWDDSTAILDFVCWGVNPHGTRKDQAEDVGKWSGDCAPATTAAAIHRRVDTTGTSAADYDPDAAPSPDNCTPEL